MRSDRADRATKVIESKMLSMMPLRESVSIAGSSPTARASSASCCTMRDQLLPAMRPTRGSGCFRGVDACPGLPQLRDEADDLLRMIGRAQRRGGADLALGRDRLRKA